MNKICCMFLYTYLLHKYIFMINEYWSLLQTLHIIMAGMQGYSYSSQAMFMITEYTH